MAMSGTLLAIHRTLEDSTDRRASLFQSGIVTLIVLNVLFVILESEPSIGGIHHESFDIFHRVSLAVFIAEYLLRIISYRASAAYKQRGMAAMMRYVASPMMLIDLAVILPFLLPFVATDTRIIRILRLLRLFTIFKMARMSESMRTFGDVIRNKTADLALAFFILFIVLIMASGLMYYAERDAQPEKFSSMPASMWWGVVTLTTIGYGDVVPVTLLGRIIGAGVAILGIAVYAIPTGIMASAFNEYRRRRRSGRFCPHCGEALD